MEKGRAAVLARKYALIELHQHLDGSLTPSDVRAMAALSGIELPEMDEATLQTRLSCPEGCKDLNDYLSCFDLPLLVMQRAEAISYAVSAVVGRLADQGLVYGEIRFAPQLHLNQGLTQEAVVQAAIKGLETVLKTRVIQAQLILCCMRGKHNQKANFETVRLAGKYLGQGVGACDLAGAEGIYRTGLFSPVFELARSLGVPFTIHAGEAAAVTSMEAAVAFGASRIGHGIRSYNAPEIQALLKEKQVTLELCPTSNLDTHALEGIHQIQDYPIGVFLKSGVAVTLNTDNPTVSRTTLENEFQQLFACDNIDETQSRVLVKNSVDAAFLPEAQKKALWTLCQARMA